MKVLAVLMVAMGTVTAALTCMGPAPSCGALVLQGLLVVQGSLRMERVLVTHTAFVVQAAFVVQRTRVLHGALTVHTAVSMLEGWLLATSLATRMFKALLARNHSINLRRARKGFCMLGPRTMALCTACRAI